MKKGILAVSYTHLIRTVRRVGDASYRISGCTCLYTGETAGGEKMDIRDVIELVKQAKPFIQNRDMADHIKVKGPADYVTQVDTNVQKFLSEKLYELAPQIQFLGEEEGLHAMSSDTFWILDPVDGTTNLIHDYQHSTV